MRSLERCEATVNKGTELRASRALELLRSLHRAAADFAEREDRIIRDLRARRFAADRKLNEAAEKIDEKTESQLLQLTAVTDQRLAAAAAAHDARKKRIERFHTRGMRDLPVLGQEARERYLGGLQMRKFKTDRDLQSSLARAEAAHSQAVSRLNELQSEIVAADKRARSAFGGYRAFSELLRRKKGEPFAGSKDARQRADALAAIESRTAAASGKLSQFQSLALTGFFSKLPLVFWIGVLLVVAIVVAVLLGLNSSGMAVGGAVFAIGLLLVLVVHQMGLQAGKPLAAEIAAELAEAVRQHEQCSAGAKAANEQAVRDAKARHEQGMAEIDAQWKAADKVEADYKASVQSKLKTQVPRATAKNERLFGSKKSQLDAEKGEITTRFKAEADERKRQHQAVHEKEAAAIAADEAARWQELEQGWKAIVEPAVRELAAMNAAVEMFRPWDAALVKNWSPPREFAPAAKFGRIDLDLSAKPGHLPRDPRLALPGPPQLSAPLALAFPHEGSLLVSTADAGGAAVAGMMNNIVLRLLANTPPGKIAFTIIDPVGLGQNFAGLMHIGDYEDAVINRRIWTQRDQIEERLAELNEHIEKVIQMYLRNEYATITEYNEQAGSVAEKYHFLVVSDFPASFTDTAAKRLQSIATSGARCGVYTLIHLDERQPLPDGFVLDELRQGSIFIRQKSGRFTAGEDLEQAGAKLSFDPPPGDDLAVELVHKIGKASIDSNRVEVPFAQVMPKPDDVWTGDTTSELRVAVGRTGATKLQYLAIGKGTKQHALFAGKTGSGKSTLFHVIITNLSLWCSPEQVEFYLIDFKKGVEFKCYAEKRLPHARVIAIESDREFGLSVLQRVDEELKRRGDLFRKLGAQDVAGYKRAGGTEPIPRTLLIIDEFQEFFVEDDAIAQGASLLFDRIVRQGRAFGIHVLLGSQTLGGAYTLARATLGQMVIRVALQCNEADAYLIMDENNPAPRLLSRPGEGIYNDAAGAIEGNSPFQVVWLSDQERDVCLDKVHDLAVERGDKHGSPIVFEGNAPAEIRENDALAAAISTPPAKAPAAGRIWLGAPNSIKGPTEAVFHRQSGNHLLIVGQREEAALVMTGLSLLALAAQYPAGAVKLVLIHGSNPESADERFFDQITRAIPGGLTVSRGHDIAEVMNGIAAELKERMADPEAASKAPPVFVFIHGLQKFKKLRHEDDFSFGGGDEAASAGAQLTELITEGSSHGVHLIATIDTFNNINRFMSRKALSEFEMRVVFQMSQNDSASLIDSPKASTLGLHRALLFNEHEGYLETFRPYALPDDEWIAEAGRKIAGR